MSSLVVLTPGAISLGRRRRRRRQASSHHDDPGSTTEASSDTSSSSSSSTLASFVDLSAHRQSLPAPYLRYYAVDADPMYVSPALERFDAALRGLFFTGWMLRDTLAAKGCNGASTVFITSASSKTALGLAWELTQNPIPGVSVVGLTSPRNVDFCQRSGCYGRVVAYGELDALQLPLTSSPPPGGQSSHAKVMYVDMAGSQEVLDRIHARFEVVPGLTVGLSHGTRLKIRHLQPTPEFYFVGTWIQHLQHASPERKWERELGESYHKFVEHIAGVMRLRKADLPQDVVTLFRDLVDGAVPPDQVCSFSLTQAAASL